MWWYTHTYSIHVNMPYHSLAHSHTHPSLIPYSLSHTHTHSQPLAKDAQLKLINLVHQMISDGNLKFAQLLRNALVHKVHKLT